ncbi:PRKR-interacting protein 1 [Coemansia sp. RSA 486]|nr:PRKR-interacting protein 1 [Coemansia sp. RSA 486]KAJ2233548.1 PRKR-interacting protein 1 [Coemansia sp. RSA 485]
MHGKPGNKRRRSADQPDLVAQETETSDNVLLKKPKKTMADIQRTEIERLMKRIDKPIEIEVSAQPETSTPREFVYNVKGSSSGASSNDFVKYQHMRRKEHQRIKTIEEEAAKDEERQNYDEELNRQRLKDEERTAKNRAKRQKRKKAKAVAANKKQPQE